MDYRAVADQVIELFTKHKLTVPDEATHFQLWVELVSLLENPHDRTRNPNNLPKTRRPL
jgi:hypothetical protein